MKNRLYFLLFIGALMSTGISQKILAQPHLDNSFNGNGLLLTKLQPSKSDIARSVLVQTNNKILLGGNSIDNIGYADLSIVRLKPNGSKDSAYGNAGVFVIPGGFFCDMALISGNKILVAGGGVGPGNKNNFIVYRVNSNGTPDTLFGNNGSVSVNINGQNMICYDMAVQPGGKILLAGYTDDGYGGHHRMLVVRLKSNGSLDPTFATGGKFILNLGTNKYSEVRQLALQSNGKIIAGGFIDTLINYSLFRYDIGAIRLNTNGTLDHTFGNAGVVQFDLGTSEIASATAVMPDGRIILGGGSNVTTPSSMVAVCLLSNGTPDPSFGNGGYKLISAFGGTTSCTSIAIEPDSEIVLAGSATYPISGGWSALVLAKLKSNGTPDITFGVNGIDTLLSSSSTQGFNDVALQQNNRIVVAGYRYTTNSNFLTARLINSDAARMQECQDVSNDVVQIKIFPNPFTDKICIQLENTASPATLSVFDLTGKAYRTVQLIGMLNEIDLSELKSGIYFLKINQSNENAKTVKIIKN